MTLRPEGCLGKLVYASAAAAHRTLGHLRSRSRAQKRSGLEVYRCRECGQWHVGSSLDNEGRASRKRRKRRLETLHETASREESL